MGKDRVHELDNVKDADLGSVLSEEIQRFLDRVEVPRGLSKVGYGSQDISSVSGIGAARNRSDLLAG
jgi:hydroxyacid-oxoacid transhydrogenase